MRNKRLTCLARSSTTKDLEEANLIRAKKYTNDHRDSKVDLKIPRGYKVIGVRCFKNTLDDVTLHIADFMVWKPTPGWMDISPEGRLKREAAKFEQLS